MFKATMPYEPYFYVSCRVSLPDRGFQGQAHYQAGSERSVEEWLMKRFEGLLVRAEREKKWDLDLVGVSQSVHWAKKVDNPAKSPTISPSCIPQALLP